MQHLVAKSKQNLGIFCPKIKIHSGSLNYLKLFCICFIALRTIKFQISFILNLLIKESKQEFKYIFAVELCFKSDYWNSTSLNHIVSLATIEFLINLINVVQKNTNLNIFVAGLKCIANLIFIVVIIYCQSHSDWVFSWESIFYINNFSSRMAKKSFFAEHQFTILVIFFHALFITLFALFAKYDKDVLPGGSEDKLYVNSKYPSKCSLW